MTEEDNRLVFAAAALGVTFKQDTSGYWVAVGLGRLYGVHTATVGRCAVHMLTHYGMMTDAELEDYLRDTDWALLTAPNKCAHPYDADIERRPRQKLALPSQ